MTEQLALLKILLANTFVTYFKAHTYHWNVEGTNFSEMHEFFGEYYGDVYATTDTFAEEMRALDAYAPFSLTDLYSVKTIDEDSTKPATAREMLIKLQAANDEMYNTLSKLFHAAEAEDNQGLMDVVASRMDAHKKHGWMIRSFLKA